MGVLSYLTGLVTVQNALADVVALALGRRYPSVADVAALRAVQSSGKSQGPSIPDRAIRYVTASDRCFVFRRASAAADDGATVILPSDGGTRPGRWLAAASSLIAPDGTPIASLQSGYVKSVLLYEGERSGKEWNERILAVRPGVVIQYVGEEKEQKSNLRGALAIKRYQFKVWGVSFNGRQRVEAALGSPIAAEATTDPGVAAIMGALEDLLDGMTGAQLGVDGVDFLSLGETNPAIEDLAHREFIWIAPLTVRATIGKEDRPTRRLLETVTAEGVDPADGVTPLTPAYQVVPS